MIWSDSDEKNKKTEKRPYWSTPLQRHRKAMSFCAEIWKLRKKETKSWSWVEFSWWAELETENKMMTSKKRPSHYRIWWEFGKDENTRGIGSSKNKQGRQGKNVWNVTTRREDDRSFWIFCFFFFYSFHWEQATKCNEGKEKGRTENARAERESTERFSPKRLDIG